MKFLAVIPARYASTRFPGKPLVRIGGIPMIQRVYERVAAHFGYCVVATDDTRIEEAVRGFGGRVVMTSTEHRSGTDRCAEALALAEKMWDTRFDAVVNVQGDEPFVSEEQLEKIRIPFEHPDTQIVTLVKKFGAGEDIFDPNKPKVVFATDGAALCFSRSVIPYLRGVERERWAAEYDFYKHIGMYAYRADTLREITRLPAGRLETAESLEQLRWLENGYRVRVVETETESLSVDTPEDLERALAMFP